MKKLVLILVVILCSFSVARGQRNSFSFSNKSLKEQKKSIELIDKEIDSLEKIAKKMNEENESLFKALSSNQMGQEESKIAREMIRFNQSQLEIVQTEISSLRSLKTTVLTRLLIEDKNKKVESKGNNPTKLRAAAEAYAVMSWVDGQQQSSFSSNSKETGYKLKGLAVNDHYSDAIVSVSGPGGFFISSPIKRRGGTFNFNPPYPGAYIFTFTFRGGRESVRVDCRPGMSVFFDKDGNPYDLKATLMSTF